jgi:hypothetical protein
LQASWRPYLKKKHRVNGRGSKESYKTGATERLKFLNLTTLDTRRVRRDLIEVFKILKGYEDVNAHTYIF